VPAHAPTVAARGAGQANMNQRSAVGHRSPGELRHWDSGKPSVTASKTPGSARRPFIGEASTAHPTGRLHGGQSAAAKVKPWSGAAGRWEVQQLLGEGEGNRTSNLHGTIPREGYQWTQQFSQETS
jgi:hypothetical protein